MGNKRPNQCKRLLAEMNSGRHFTAASALYELSIGRLPSRVYELRAAGVPIKDQYVDVKNKYGETCRVKEYWIDETK